MKRDDTLKQLEELFKEILDNDHIRLSEETTANDVEEWDSLTHIQLIVEIEKKFNIRFSSKEIRKWNNVGEMLDSVCQKLG